MWWPRQDESRCVSCSIASAPLQPLPGAPNRASAHHTQLTMLRVPQKAALVVVEKSSKFDI